MTSVLRSADRAAVPATGPAGPPSADPALEESAEQIASALIHMMRQFNGIKSRVTTSPEGDHSPLYLLVKLVEHGPRRASDLAEQVCADPSTVSRQVASLVKAGLIERRADPADGRASILVPTDLGLARVRQHAERRGVTMQPIIADWSQRDRDDLLRLIRQYTAGIEAHREQIISTMLEHHLPGVDRREATSPPTTHTDTHSALWKESI